MRHTSRLTAATVALAASFGLSACGTSFDAQTNQQYQAGVGTDLRDGDVQVLAAVLVDNGDETSTLAGTLLNKGDAVAQLTGVTAETLKGDALDVQLSDPTLDLPTDIGVQLGKDGGLIVTVDGTTVGAYVELTLEFADSESITIQVPVDDRSAQYVDIVGDSGNAEAEDEPAEEEAGH